MEDEVSPGSSSVDLAEGMENRTRGRGCSAKVAEICFASLSASLQMPTSLPDRERRVINLKFSTALLREPRLRYIRKRQYPAAMRTISASATPKTIAAVRAEVDDFVGAREESDADACEVASLDSNVWE